MFSSFLWENFSKPLTFSLVFHISLLISPFPSLLYLNVPILDRCKETIICRKEDSSFKDLSTGFRRICLVVHMDKIFDCCQFLFSVNIHESKILHLLTACSATITINRTSRNLDNHCLLALLISQACLLTPVFSSNQEWMTILCWNRLCNLGSLFLTRLFIYFIIF